jgi:hypothetical protein
MADDPTPVEPGGEPPAQEARPEWLPGNFESPEQLAQSWSEANRKITEQGQETARLRDELDSMAELVQQSQMQPPQQYDYQQNPLAMAAQQAWDNGDAQAFLAINAQIADAVANEKFQALQQAQQPNKAANDSMLAVYGDMAERNLQQTYGPDLYGELSGRAAELLQSGQVQITDPNSLGGVQSAMDTAFRHAASEKLFKQQQDAAAVAAEDAKVRQAKLDGQTLQPSGGRPPAPDQQEQVWNEIVAAGANRFRT